MPPNLLAHYPYLWEPTVVRQAIETAWISASSGGHSLSYGCQQRRFRIPGLPHIASWKRPSVCLRATAKPRREEGEPQPTPPTAAKKAAAPARPRGRQRAATGKPASSKRSAP